MNNVEHVKRSGTLAAIRWMRLCWLLAVAALLAACSSVHGSTETGNPPVIDVNKVALVVGSDEVRIVGQRGAVRPGGVTVELLIVGTGEVVRRTANADGSFDVSLSAGADAVVEVRAVAGEAASRTVYVTRGGASVGTGDDASLSCMERSNLASQAVGNAISVADISCQTAADCNLISTQTSCTDSCSDTVVARRAQADLLARVKEIDRSLCADFKSDGCSLIALPCVPPPDGPLSCVAGKCLRQSTAEVACPSCLNQTISWGPTSGLVTNTISACESYQRVTRVGSSSSCAGEVPHCNSASAAVTIEQLSSALAQSDVEAALASGALVGGPPTPGGMGTQVTVGDRSFAISNCGTGPNCTAIPGGIVQLKDLLDRIASETSCEPAACPPNAVYISDYCASCGPAGGCAQTEGRCAVVCSNMDSSPCASGTVCSARGVCEPPPCF